MSEPENEREGDAGNVSVSLTSFPSSTILEERMKRANEMLEEQIEAHLSDAAKVFSPQDTK